MFDKTFDKIKRFLADEDGPTAIEYVVMTSAVVIVCLLAINAIGSLTQDSFSNSSESITDAVAS